MRCVRGMVVRKGEEGRGVWGKEVGRRKVGEVGGKTEVDGDCVEKSLLLVVG